MAKAKFHKSQRVFVRPVGTWAHIEKVMPKWVNGCDEPIRVHYDVGLGRPFGDKELETEQDALGNGAFEGHKWANWRVVRGQNRWRTAEQCAHHPNPGTHPVIVTTDREISGWRVTGVEYDLDPHRIESEARIMAKAPDMLALLRQLAEHGESDPDNMSDSLLEIAKTARETIRDVDA